MDRGKGGEHIHTSLSLSLSLSLSRVEAHALNPKTTRRSTRGRFEFLDSPKKSPGICVVAELGRAQKLSLAVTGPEAHSLQKPRKGVPVVKHEVSHAQEGDLLQPPSAGAAAKCAVSDAVKRIVVIPAQMMVVCVCVCVCVCLVSCS
jgi:hypothetical protein